jgi:hypothetical protein
MGAEGEGSQEDVPQAPLPQPAGSSYKDAVIGGGGGVGGAVAAKSPPPSPNPSTPTEAAGEVS